MIYQVSTGNSCGVMANILDCNFKLQLDYYIHFWINTLGKGMNYLIP